MFKCDESQKEEKMVSTKTTEQNLDEFDFAPLPSQTRPEINVLKCKESKTDEKNLSPPK